MVSGKSGCWYSSSLQIYAKNNKPFIISHSCHLHLRTHHQAHFHCDGCGLWQYLDSLPGCQLWDPLLTPWTTVLALWQVGHWIASYCTEIHNQDTETLLKTFNEYLIDFGKKVYSFTFYAVYSRLRIYDNCGKDYCLWNSCLSKMSTKSLMGAERIHLRIFTQELKAEYFKLEVVSKEQNGSIHLV